MSSAPPSETLELLALRKQREEFERHVRENERLAAADPVGYRRKLRSLVALGYGYIGLMLLLALGLIVGIAYLILSGGRVHSGEVKLVIVGLGLLYAILRSLWVKIDPPEGFLLTRERFPKLWAEVESIADRLKAPRPDEIRLDEEFNASASQWPRFGMFGGYRQTLTLGLPLLAGLTPDEARGVIAHEFGHFSGSHGRFGVWIYRVNRTWAQRGENLADSGWTGALFKPFVAWFFPRFTATSFAIRRQHEYEADRAAVEIVGAPTVARTLTRLSPLGDHLRRTFWKGYERELLKTGQPFSNFTARLTLLMGAPLDAEAARRQASLALAQTTDYDDTHPSLTDRLASIGASAPTDFPPVGSPTAADEFLGEHREALEREFDDYYSAKVAPFLKAIAGRRAAMEARHQALSQNPRSEEEEVELAFLTTELRQEDPVPVYRDLHDRFPENADAKFLLGSALLEQDDEEGEALIQSAVVQKPSLGDDARQELAAFYARRGEAERLSALREEAQDAYDRATVAESAAGLTLQDELLPPELSEEERTKLVAIFGQVKGLAQAYVFRKRLPGTGELRHYLVPIPKSTAFVGDDTLGYFTKQLNKLEEPPIPLTIAVVAGKKWRARLSEVEGALLFGAKAS